MSDEPATESDVDEFSDQGSEASEGETAPSAEEAPPPEGFVPL
ncbi:hypothetical protein ACTMTF_13845 [Nonomuraea sp. ZG12]